MEKKLKLALIGARGHVGYVLSVLKNLPDIGKLPDVIQGISCAGDKIKLLVRAEGDHIRNLIGDFRVALPGDLNHSGGKVHARGPDAGLCQNLTQNTGAAA